MRRAFIVAAAGLTLAGCGSLSLPSIDALAPAPPQMTLQLESVPPGAEAKTSMGPSCRTPCALSIPRTANFTVTYTLDRYLPQTVPVQLIEPQFDPQQDYETTTLPEARFDPSPVYAELQPAPPPPRKRAAPKAAPKRTTPSPQAQQQQPAPPPAAPQSPVQSRFPPPTQSGFPPPR